MARALTFTIHGYHDPGTYVRGANEDDAFDGDLASDDWQSMLEFLMEHSGEREATDAR